MAATNNQRRVRRAANALALALALVVVLATSVSVVAAAGTTDIGVSVDADDVGPGDTATVDVVVESVDGGVGALNATVTLSNPDVASVENVTIHGDSGLENVNERSDGVELSAALADTDDAGNVTIATVVLRAEEPGETAVDVNVHLLGDEDGVAYDVAAIDRPTLTVADDDPSSSDNDGSSRTLAEAIDDDESTEEGSESDNDDDESIDRGSESDDDDDESTEGSAGGDSQDVENPAGGTSDDSSADEAPDDSSAENEELSRPGSDDPIPIRYGLAGPFGALCVIAGGAIVLFQYRHW